MRDSLEIFAKYPSLIIPKLVIAFLYSVLILVTADLTAQLFLQPEPEFLAPLLVNMLFLLGATFGVSIADIFAGSMYPFMVEGIKKTKKISLKGAFGSAVKKIRVTIPSLLIVEIGFLVVVFLVSAPLAFVAADEFEYFVLFSGVYLVLIFLVVFFFYLVYPFVTLEKNSIASSLRKSIRFSMGHRADVAKAVIVSFLLSGLSFGIAFLIEFFPASGESALFWIAFIIVRFLTAYVYSYLFVLNPVFYMHYVKQK